MDEREVYELSSRENGARIVFATDDYFGVAKNLLKEEEPVQQEGFTNFGKRIMDGWVTKSRHEKKLDFAIIEFAADVKIDFICIDTAFFSNNFPIQFFIQSARRAIPVHIQNRTDRLSQNATLPEMKRINQIYSEEWAIFMLGHIGKVHYVIIDTTYVKGNAPSFVHVEGLSFPAMTWLTLIPETKESKLCENDKDCDYLDYHCYNKLCVDSTHICSRYNRIKSEVKTIDGRKCGPCKTGYSKEILADGKENDICQKNVTDTKPYYVGSTMDNTTDITKLTLMIIFPILIVFITIYLLMWFIRNKRNFFTLNNAANTELAITEVATTNTNDELTSSISLEEQIRLCISYSISTYLNAEMKVRRIQTADHLQSLLKRNVVTIITDEL
ncbi:uncharacterized protein LOC143905765 isoform X2 [Temnothorax americanus]|uniref:uncharacterized protein LOC143905765 isoform X2 n=1 Tax=Temnothorax americanus TaxID=1964332 RepID=UPI00406882F9